MDSQDMEQEIPDQSEDEESLNPRKTRRIGLIIASCILLLIVGTALGGGLFIANGFAPVEPSDQEVRINIAEGTKSADIAQTLEENGLIHSATAFKLYLRYKKEGSRFQAGEYSMKPGMELDEMIAMMNNGDTVKVPTFKFTVPEGYTVAQIADKLNQQGLINRDTFINLANGEEKFESSYIAEIPVADTMPYRLEGYLFPETYEMVEGSNESEIIARMVHELDNKLQKLPEDWQQQMEKHHMNFHQIMTIASLIEREVVVDEERPIVAGVIYNRLTDGMPLQIDATIQYVLGSQKEVLATEDTKIDSPYNTYQIQGLPPGPIASPGINSIKAALYPADTDYLFYVTKKDGTQEHYFAVTYSEHLNNINRSKQEKQ